MQNKGNVNRIIKTQSKEQAMSTDFTQSITKIPGHTKN